MYRTGVVEKYEGQKSSELIKEMYPRRQPVTGRRQTDKLETVSPQYLEQQRTVLPELPVTVSTPSTNSKPDEVSISKSEDIVIPVKKKEKGMDVSTEDEAAKEKKEKMQESTPLEEIETPSESESESEDEKEKRERAHQETGRGNASTDNLPIKTSSKVAAVAAAMMQERDAMTELKRPIRPSLA